MSLKSSEINNCSWNVSAILISSFYSSSCCQTCFPTIVRPMLYLWKLIPKIILYSPELNCSVVFPLYCLRVSKKTDYFLRDLVRSESLFCWLSIHLLLLIGMMLDKSTGSLLCGFAFAFDLAAKTFTMGCDVSSSRSAGTSVLLWFAHQSRIYLIREKF